MKKWYLTVIALVLIGVTSTLVIVQKAKSNEDNYKNISLHDLERKLDQKESFITYIYSTTCPACKKLRPVLNSTIKEKKVEVLALNISLEENYDEQFFKENNIKVTPTLIYFNDGVEKGKKEGNISKKALENFIDFSNQ
ncbi:thioredoxin family protein [Heyndrickxia sp. FSL W8-0496]|uniref:thioredoxin family protein n=1 Tax=Heyndrickxia TaxID=2837504 RepID=UPI0030F6CBEC